MVCAEPIPVIEQHFSYLMQNGFRRSGDQLYRPHCPQCNKCRSLRVIVEEFQPSTSQKRVLAKNSDLEIGLVDDMESDFYPLYAHYINTRHADGSMFPPNEMQFTSFLRAEWLSQLWLTVRDRGELVGVAAIDEVNDGWSALYSFYHPNLNKRSLGRFLILLQIKQLQAKGLPHLYLGYQVDECKKMNYKSQYQPFETFYNGEWHRNSTA